MAGSTVLSTLGGALVGGVLLYAVHEAMQDQTRYMVTTLHSRVEGLEHAGEFDRVTGKRHAVLASDFQPGPPTYLQEMQARWNYYLLELVRGVRDSDPLRLLRPASEPEPANEAPSMFAALHSLAPHAPDAEPKIGILHRTYGDANTHYLGQGASLR